MLRFLLGRFRLAGPDPQDPTQPHKQYTDVRVTADGAMMTSSGAGARDAFGLQKVGEPFTVFDNKNVGSKHDTRWAESVSGGGAVSYLQSESAVKLEVGTASGDFAIRQSLPHPLYVPGKSHESKFTMVMGPTKANVVSRVGLFDDDNGVYLERNETDERLVIRTDTSGSPVDTQFATRDNWNIDKLDGTGPSGVTIDFSKTQIFFSELQWLGVGRVRLGFDFGLSSGPVFVHEFQNANSISKVYMRDPNLPVRFEIRNIGTSASASEMKELCSVVVSNAGHTLPGFDLSRSNGVTTRAVTTRLPIMAIRLKGALHGLPNRDEIRLIRAWVYTESVAVFFEVCNMHNPTGITASWVDAGTDSAVEYSTDITAITGSPGRVVNTGVVPASTVGNNSTPGAADSQGDFENVHNTIYQNFDSNNSQVLVIYATSMGATTDVSAGMTWRQKE